LATRGCKNTKFFHLKATNRRRKNRIEAINDEQGMKHYDNDKIEEIFLAHFNKLFTNQTTQNILETTEVVKGKITEEMFLTLSEVFTELEVVQAIKDMKPFAAPGPDGLPAYFYHTYWDILKNDIC
jgi:hypothetical protein